MEREHDMFGYDLGDIPTRMERFEEGVEVIARLLRSEEPVSFDGQFYRLQEAVLPDPKRRGGPEIAIGGNGPKRTMPLVARFADSWNAGHLSPEQMQERNGALDQLVIEEGRRPEEVERVLNVPIACWRTSEERKRRLRELRRFKDTFRAMTDDQLEDELRAWPAIFGKPEDIIERLHAYATSGVSEFEAKWWDPDDIDGLNLLATEVLPQLA